MSGEYFGLRRLHFDSHSGLEMTRRDYIVRLSIYYYSHCNHVLQFSFVTFEIHLYYLNLMLVFALIRHHNVILLPLSGWGVTPSLSSITPDGLGNFVPDVVRCKCHVFFWGV
jgi:hypothetical protein